MAAARRRRARRHELPPEFSGFRGMWLFALFDLPVKQKDQRRAYARFRKLLLMQGFTQLQYSVYAQYCPSEDASAAKRRKIRGALPEEGQVRLLSVTDCQFAGMEVFLGETPSDPEQPLGQGLLF